jgi:S-adenosylmethionine hydrolase
VSHPILTLTSDFGSRDAYVGVMKGVILGIAPNASLVDLSHEIPPQAITIGALVLRSAVEFFPTGTVHLAVVDPGVGSSRLAVAVMTEQCILVGPDNGLLYPSATALGIREVRRLERQEFFRPEVSHTFHGRDIFAPVAAHLAAGVPAQELGERVDELQPLTLPVARHEDRGLIGEVIYVDHFGNLVTNLGAADVATFPVQGLSVTIGEVSLPAPVPSYAAVKPGQPLAIVGSWGQIEVAVRNGNAAQYLSAGVGTVVRVSIGR